MSGSVQIFSSGHVRLAPVSSVRTAQVEVWQCVGGDDPDPMSVGFATYRGEFAERLLYDVTYFLVSGRLELHHEGRIHRAEAGDVVFIATGSRVLYRSPDGCRVFWVCHPGNWQARYAERDALGRTRQGETRSASRRPS